MIFGIFLFGLMLVKSAISGLYDGCVTGSHQVREDSSGDLEKAVYSQMYYCDSSNNRTRSEYDFITWYFFLTRDHYVYSKHGGYCNHFNISGGEIFSCQVCMDNPKKVKDKDVYGGNTRVVNGNNATYWQSLHGTSTEGDVYTYTLFAEIPKVEDVRPIVAWSVSRQYGDQGSSSYNEWEYFGDRWGGDPHVWDLPDVCKKAKLEKKQ